MDDIKIDIIIVTYKRPFLLKKCLDSICDDICRGMKTTITVVINGDDQETSFQLEEWLLNHNKIPVKIISKSLKRTPAAARNIAIMDIQSDKSDYIVFFDDDVTIPSGYFTNVCSLLRKHPEIDVLGGPDRNSSDAGRFEKIFSLALSSPLCTAHTRYRHVSYDNKLVRSGENKLILCHMWFRASLFSMEGFCFDERFFRGEENVLIMQLARREKNIYYKGDIFVFHKRKSKIKNVIQSYFRSGFSRIRSFFLYPEISTIIYFMPILLLWSSIILVLCGFIAGYLPLFLYLALSFLMSVYYSIKAGCVRYVFHLFILKSIIISSYVAGGTVGLFYFGFPDKIKINSIKN